jgi:GntR family transcriptional regulator/MocR family aminotransferase
LAFLTLDDTGTLTDRLFRALRAAVHDGRLAAGEQLPSSRQLAADLGLSRKVVATAYAHLTDEGYLEGRHGAGTFVSAVVPDFGLVRAESPQPAMLAPALVSPAMRRASSRWIPGRRLERGAKYRCRVTSSTACQR